MYLGGNEATTLRLETVDDLLPEYNNTYTHLQALMPDSFSFDKTDRIMVLKFSNPNGSLLLTTEELKSMNDRFFLVGYQENANKPTKDDILTAIKAQFGKEIWPANSIP